jgi:ABC-type transport system involved in multi-copper enzyme maturation permease subunit
MNAPPEQAPHPEDVSVPRWVQVPAGIALGGIVLLCLAGSLMMVFLPNEKAPVLAPVFGAFMALVSLWALSKCFLLLSGKKVRGGLIKPRWRGSSCSCPSGVCFRATSSLTRRKRLSRPQPTSAFSLASGRWQRIENAMTHNPLFEPTATGVPVSSAQRQR